MSIIYHENQVRQRREAVRDSIFEIREAKTPMKTDAQKTADYLAQSSDMDNYDWLEVRWIWYRDAQKGLREERAK